MRWKVPAAVVLLAVGAGAVALAVTGGPGGSRASGPRYLTATAATADVADTVVANGTLARATTYGLNFGVAPTVSESTDAGSGNGTWSVKDVKVKEGDVVKKGDVLAVADTTSLQRDLKAAKASLTAAKTQRTIAKGQLDDASGTDARRQARIGYENAVSQHTQAQGQVADLEKQIAYATIVAPADGTVDAVTAVAGADLATGPAITLSSGALQATADFTESDLPSLKTGQSATVTVDAVDATINGKVVGIAPSAAGSSGNVVTYAVTIELTDPPATTRPGMSAKAAVMIADATGVLAVPAVALSGSALDGYSVLVVGADGAAEPRQVVVGLVTSTQAEIKSGLQAGEAVVIGTTASQTTSTGGGGFFPGGGGTFQRNGGNGGNNSGGGNGPTVTQP